MSPATTTAQVIDAYGGPDAFTTAKRPIAAPGPGEVQIRVAAAAVNPVDLQTRAGYVVPLEAAHFPMVLGWDLAGAVGETADGVEGWELGERIAAMSFQPIDQNGTYSQYVNLSADLLARVPDGLQLEQAATVPLAGLTASQLMAWVNLPAGATLLVNGPVGGVGRLVLQLASHAGIEVIAVVKPEDRDYAIELGASHVVDRGEFSGAVRELHPSGVDGAIDVVGRAAGQEAVASVRDGGVCATTFNDYEDPTNQLRSERGIQLTSVVVHYDTAELTRLLEAAGRGELTTTIDRTYPLTAAADAHRRLEQGGVRGKLVLLP